MIRAFLGFLETHGVGDVPAGELRAALAADGEDGRAALVGAGVLRAGPPATTYPCDGLDCAREVRARTDGRDGARRFLAVCTRTPRACETVHLAESELAQETIALGPFLEAVRSVLRIERPLDDGALAARARSSAPVLLGEQVQDGTARDVFFARRPRAAAFRALLAERQTAARATLVLIPTARGIAPEVLARHGGGHVQIAVLADWLTTQNGKIVAAARAHLRIVPPAGATAPAANAPAPPRRSALDQLPRPKRWNEVTFYLVDHESAIGVEIGRRQRRITAADLGMTSGRTHTPVRAFVLLRRICDGNGVFDTRPWGGRENGKQIVSELRRALGAAFALEEAAIEPYSRSTKSWKPRFRAFMAAPREVRGLLD